MLAAGASVQRPIFTLTADATVVTLQAGTPQHGRLVALRRMTKLLSLALSARGAMVAPI